MIAGSRFRGEFEERLKAAMEEIQRAQGEIILLLMSCIPSWGGFGPGPWTPATCSSLLWRVASCGASAQPHWTNIASTSSAIPRWSAALRRCSSTSRP